MERNMQQRFSLKSLTLLTKPAGRWVSWTSYSFKMLIVIYYRLFFTLYTCCFPLYFMQSFFEAASLMSQISHKHLLLVYGVSVHGVKSKLNSKFSLCRWTEIHKSVNKWWKNGIPSENIWKHHESLLDPKPRLLNISVSVFGLKCSCRNKPHCALQTSWCRSLSSTGPLTSTWRDRDLCQWAGNST